MKPFLAGVAFCALLGVAMAADEPPAPASAAPVPAGAVPAAAPPLFQIVIQPSALGQYGSSAGVGRPNQFGRFLESNLTGATAEQILQSTAEVPRSRLIIDAKLPQGTFDVFARLPNASRRALDPILWQAAEATFKLSSKHELRDLEAYVVTVKSTDAKGLRPTATPNKNSTMAGLGAMNCVSVPIAGFAKNLERLLQKPLIDETGLKGEYDIDFYYGKTDADSLIADIADQLGLQLTLATRPMDVVVVVNQEAASKKASETPAK